MALTDDLRKRCSQLKDKREKEVEEILSKYFTTEFIETHTTWCSAIQPLHIYRDFGEGLTYKWPNLSEERLREILESLGFEVKSNNISLSIPENKNTDKLTFAQEWKNKINDAYSAYCMELSKKAHEMYEERLSELYLVPDEKIITHKNYTIFNDFEFVVLKDARCIKKFREYMKQDGIEEYFEDGKYIGIKVYHDKPE